MGNTKLPEVSIILVVIVSKIQEECTQNITINFRVSLKEFIFNLIVLLLVRMMLPNANGNTVPPFTASGGTLHIAHC